MHNIAFEALYLPFISPNLAALLIGQSLEAGLLRQVRQRNSHLLIDRDGSRSGY